MTAGVVLMVVLALPALGDTVFLKNGNTVEGVVTSQTQTEVEVDIGYGSVTLQRADIARIKRASNKEIERRQFESGSKFPPEADKLNSLYQAAKAARDKAQENKSQGDGLKESADDARSEVSDLRERRQALLRELGAVKPNEPDKYNRVVDDLNSVSARLAADEQAIRGSAEQGRGIDPAAGAYSSAVAALQDYVAGDEFRDLAKGASGWQADYYAWAKEEAARMQKDFDSKAVQSVKRGPHVVVSAVINGKVTAHLMVDTGATIVVLNKDISDRLRIPVTATSASAKLTVADGRTITAPVARLDSLEVGGSKVEGVEAAMPPTSIPDCDGLLGMSFLRHFEFHIDSAGNTLVLQSLK